ncbi:MAG: hypothetical protein FD134_67 [Gallionellaceae bacterium]|nr:MAG: hypothetical protein FD134_67 [Gallionellaceae bacterium]
MELVANLRKVPKGEQFAGWVEKNWKQLVEDPRLKPKLRESVDSRVVEKVDARVKTTPSVKTQPAHSATRSEVRPAEPPVNKSRVLGKSVAELEHSTYGGVKAVRVRSGTNTKVAVIGRSMSDAVEPFSKGSRGAGYNVETFSGDKIPSTAAEQWTTLKKRYSPEPIPEDVVRKSQMFQENQAWAQKLKDQGYTVVDVGNPGGQKNSPFYDMEKQILFGDGSIGGAIK